MRFGQNKHYVCLLFIGQKVTALYLHCSNTSPLIYAAKMSQILAKLNYWEHWQSGGLFQGNDWLKSDQKQGNDYNVKVLLHDYCMAYLSESVMHDSDSRIGSDSVIIPLLTGIGIRIKHLKNSWNRNRNQASLIWVGQSAEAGHLMGYNLCTWLTASGIKG